MSEFKISEEMSLDTPWRIGEQNFRYVVDLISQNQADNMYEFGSGASSIRLSKALPKSTITSIEHDLHYFKQAKALKKKYQEITGSLSIEHRPLKWQFVGGAPFITYFKMKLLSNCDVVDVVIVDGPPYWTRRGREACLYQVFPVLKKGGLIFLDDIHREREQIILHNWLETYPGALESLDRKNEISTLAVRKARDIEPQASLKYLCDKYEQYLRYWATKFLKRDPNV